MKETNSTWEANPVFDAERRRIRAAYERRALRGDSGRYSLFTPYAVYSLQERERTLLRLLREADITTLGKLRILDVGCGEGGPLRRLLDYGAEPHLMVGVDLIEEHLKKAQTANPSIPCTCADAVALPFLDETFDLVTQFTVFTSVLEPSYRQAIAQEMLRVLRPGGKIVWYDFFYDNPTNADVRGIRKDEIRALFPRCKFQFRRISLAPPLGRSLPLFPLLYDFLSVLRLFSSHYLCLGEKL